LKLGTIDLNKIRINYQNDVSNLKTNLDLGQLLVDIESINLKNQRIAIKSIKLENTKTEVILGKSEQAKVVVKEVTKVAVSTINNNWRATSGKPRIYATYTATPGSQYHIRKVEFSADSSKLGRNRIT
jgi:hypothetical protein